MQDRRAHGCRRRAPLLNSTLPDSRVRSSGIVQGSARGKFKKKSRIWIDTCFTIFVDTGIKDGHCRGELRRKGIKTCRDWRNLPTLKEKRREGIYGGDYHSLQFSWIRTRLQVTWSLHGSSRSSRRLVKKVVGWSGYIYRIRQVYRWRKWRNLFNLRQNNKMIHRGLGRDWQYLWIMLGRYYRNGVVLLPD